MSDCMQEEYGTVLYEISRTRYLCAIVIGNRTVCVVCCCQDSYIEISENMYVDR